MHDFERGRIAWYDLVNFQVLVPNLSVFGVWSPKKMTDRWTPTIAQSGFHLPNIARIINTTIVDAWLQSFGVEKGFWSVHNDKRLLSPCTILSVTKKYDGRLGCWILNCEKFEIQKSKFKIQRFCWILKFQNSIFRCRFQKITINSFENWPGDDG